MRDHKTYHLPTQNTIIIEFMLEFSRNTIAAMAASFKAFSALMGHPLAKRCSPMTSGGTAILHLLLKRPGAANGSISTNLMSGQQGWFFTCLAFSFGWVCSTTCGWFLRVGLLLFRGSLAPCSEHDEVFPTPHWGLEFEQLVRVVSEKESFSTFVTYLQYPQSFFVKDLGCQHGLVPGVYRRFLSTSLLGGGLNRLETSVIGSFYFTKYKYVSKCFYGVSLRHLGCVRVDMTLYLRSAVDRNSLEHIVHEYRLTCWKMYVSQRTLQRKAIFSKT